LSNKSDLYKEARRCADRASRGVSPTLDSMFGSLSRFYGTLAESEPNERRGARKGTESSVDDRRPKTAEHHRLRP